MSISVSFVSWTNVCSSRGGESATYSKMDQIVVRLREIACACYERGCLSDSELHMWIRRILRAMAVLASALVLTSAVMFWLTLADRSRESEGWWRVISATPVYEYSGGNALDT